MKTIRVAFVNFWPAFDTRRNHFVLLMARRFNVSVQDDPSSALLVFESYFGKASPQEGAKSANRELHQANSDQIRVFFAGEPRNLPVGRHHAVISGNTLRAPNHFRYPLWLLLFPLDSKDPTGQEWRNFGEPISYDMTQRRLDVNGRPKFACAVFNNRSHFRYEAIRQLSARGGVDVFGRAAGIPILSKSQVLRHYRINLCMENAVQPGYVTEKPVEARAAGCLPLWWGDPTYRMDFHERALVNLYEYDLNIERVFDEVDFNEIAETPLLKRHPDEINTELECFLYQLVSHPPNRLFLDVTATTSLHLCNPHHS